MPDSSSFCSSALDYEVPEKGWIPPVNRKSSDNDAHVHSNLSRRDLLRRLSVSAAGAFGAMRQARGIPEKKFLTLWGTATLNIGENGWQRFTRETAINVRFEDNKNDPGPIVQKLVEEGQANWRHISGLQGGAERVLAQNGAIIPWNISRLKNYDKLWPLVRNIPYTTYEKECYGIPTVINADSMIYRPDLAGHVKSYEAIFDPVFRGKTAMEDAWINSVILTAIYLKENGIFRIDKPGNLSESELREVMRFLVDHAKSGQFCRLWSGVEEAVNLISSGRAYVMMGWEPIAIEAANRGVPVKYAEPREGYEGWSNDLLLHPGAQKDGLLDTAHAFADWELGGYYGCMIALRSGYAVPTDAAVLYAQSHPEDFDPKEIKNLTKNVERKFLVMKADIYWQNVMPENKKLYEEEWAKFREIVNNRRDRK